tara:strand:+ start:384 stop:584 length:201 start_codon:yes stop_codon:yes gene_type:complete
MGKVKNMMMDIEEFVYDFVDEYGNIVDKTNTWETIKSAAYEKFPASNSWIDDIILYAKIQSEDYVL